MSRIGESRKLNSLVTLSGSGQTVRDGEACICGEERIRAPAELPGVVRDSAYVKDDQGTRETLLMEPAKEGIHNLEACRKRVGKAHKSEEAE